ncbi:uncharacterized protein LTR77_002017 [Saxophila tyrrhenica]|uniref:Small ribosomal subunit protein mS29 n=1 Tax=Saxophila tyrrhenica TaxID=1690608 RepID=A0AAV9PLY2_9PEZI|nr:hypothetical protein LTR77_002017 [Saxophila tyrrhenica]
MLQLWESEADLQNRQKLKRKLEEEEPYNTAAGRKRAKQKAIEQAILDRKTGKTRRTKRHRAAPNPVPRGLLSLDGDSSEDVGEEDILKGLGGNGVSGQAPADVVQPGATHTKKQRSKKKTRRADATSHQKKGVAPLQEVHVNAKGGNNRLEADGHDAQEVDNADSASVERNEGSISTHLPIRETATEDHDDEHQQTTAMNLVSQGHERTHTQPLDAAQQEAQKRESEERARDRKRRRRERKRAKRAIRRQLEEETRPRSAPVEGSGKAAYFQKKRERAKVKAAARRERIKNGEQASLRSLEVTGTRDPAQRAAFSTTAPLSAGPPPPKKQGALKKGRTLKLAKNTRGATARPPAVGERKALKKRIVLSNTNALRIEGLPDFTGDKLVRHEPGTVALDKFRGQVLGLNDDTVDALRALESFKPSQAWSLFRRPASLVRAETAQLANLMADAEGDGKKVARKVMYGSRGNGKSVMLLQAHAMAFLKDWLVIHVPEAQDLTNAHTSYQPVSSPDGPIYIQPHYTAKLLSNIARANQKLLSSLQLSKQHRLPVPVQSNMSLSRFVELGAQDPDLAWPIWQALWSELTAPSQSQSKEGLNRPPVLVTMDGVDQAMRNSAYLDSDVNPIHAHDLALPRDFVSLLSGQTSLPNGGMVLAATCDSNRASAPTLDHCLAHAYAVQNETEPPSWDPFVAKDAKVEAALEGVEALKLPGISKSEARGVMEYYAQSGLLRNTVTEGLVSEKWTLAGSGIIAELEKATVRARFN